MLYCSNKFMVLHLNLLIVICFLIKSNFKKILKTFKDKQKFLFSKMHLQYLSVSTDNISDKRKFENLKNKIHNSKYFKFYKTAFVMIIL